MTDVSAHLRACRDDYRRRAHRPVVAWDCLGAATWGDVCDRLADDVDELGLTGERAIGFLKAKAKEASDASGDMRGIGLVVSLDLVRQFQIIMDPIARDPVGWIKVRGHREHFGREGVEGMPEYRRMLGTNNCVAYLKRDWGESRGRFGSTNPRTPRIEAEDAWEARRVAWLARYNPGIQVIHGEGGWIVDPTEDRGASYTPLYGTVAEHMAEPFPTAFPDAIGVRCAMRPVQALAA